MNALKSVSRTDEHLIVENHIVLFGGRDLEGTANDRVNPDGSIGEYFTKATDLRSPYTNTGVLYLDWEHGFAPDGEPDKDSVLGFVDWTTAKADEAGVIVRRILDRRNRFVQMIEPLIEEGLIGTSSEAITQGVQKAKNGEIKRWPLKRDSLTVKPMDPRMLSANALTAAKALAEQWPALKSAVMVADEPPSTQDQSEPETASVDIVKEDNKPTPTAQDALPAAEPETEPEPAEDNELIALLGEFVTTISTIIGDNNNV